MSALPQKETLIERRSTRPKTQNQTQEIKNRAKPPKKPSSVKVEEPELIPERPMPIQDEPDVEPSLASNSAESSLDPSLMANALAGMEVPPQGSVEAELAYQQALQRKRELKGSYKAKLSLDKLIVEHERKKLHLQKLANKRADTLKDLEKIGSDYGRNLQDKVPQKEQIEPYNPVVQRTHMDFLFKEMKWMQEDFEREHKKKTSDAKKNARNCRRGLTERKLKKEKQQKDFQLELKRKANNMSKMVQVFWKSVEKISRHNYQVISDHKKQQQRARKLENFVSKHLKLSVRVAEELNTKSFVEQSMYKDAQGNLVEHNESLREQVRVYDSQTGFEEKPNEDQQITSLADMTVKMAEAFQPIGTDLQSANVLTKVPFLLHGSLREYQIIGLDWLVTLHNKRLNGILADEMGLGKTIQTISMLASLATDKGIWGPHLIIVPTTIMINWEMEFKRWCPSLKVLTYFGSQKERKQKRQGWSKDNHFHVCITSYKLVIQDHFVFRRKKWYYMVLDEAQNIKNFKSQRWQTLLRFNTRRRLLLTGTPLQNDVMELWSLMHFLMPQIFSSQQDFKEWFSNPFSQSINQNQSLNLSVVQKLQSILRPFLLRRLKRDVEKQLPEKIEHIVQCNLSRRQRLLYDEYINNDKTQSTLVQADFFSIMNVLMQLRKVCNHPDLFESRTIDSPFIMADRQAFYCPQLVFTNTIGRDKWKVNPCDIVNFTQTEVNFGKVQADLIKDLFPQQTLQEAYNCPEFLNQPNTGNLAVTVPQILPHNPPFHKHKHPRFLSAASLPCAHDFYKLSHQQEKKYESFTQTRIFAQTKRLVALYHADLRNRRNLLFHSCPIYGHDLRQKVQVPMPLAFDANSRQPQHFYVNRHTKSKAQQYSQVPSTVWNPPQGQQRNPITVTDLTEPDYAPHRLITEVKPQERHRAESDQKSEADVRIETREVVVEGPPGIHGVIIQVDLQKAKEAEAASDCLHFYSLKLVTETVAVPLTPESSLDINMMEDQIGHQDLAQDAKSDQDADMKSQHAESSDTEDQDEADEKRRANEANENQTQVVQEELEHQILPRFTDHLREMVTSPQQRISVMEDSIKYFKCIIPKVVARSPRLVPTKLDTRFEKKHAYERFAYQKLMSHRTVTQTLKWSNILFFPHKNLVQYDCGKLQRLAQLLKTLYLKGSKVLIFTQMTRMLDILEQFLNLHGYTYVRLDGSVKVEARQKMVDRFNLSPKLFCFISSTRCGGIGINLTGADCVIFYDTDWNPAMDKQAQDRSHRIGQTKTVHIYRLISVNTVEENIFKKSLQKRELGSLIIAGEAFDSSFFQQPKMKDLLANNVDALMPQIRRKNILQEENIVFHDQKYTGEGKSKEENQAEEVEMEAYRQKFEEAMIRIEDEEDIEAYKEAKAELDDEFREIEEDKEILQGDTTTVKEDVELEGQKTEVNKEEHMEKKQQQPATHVLDSKNAAGLSRDMRRNELIDWQHNEQLNAATKMAIRYFEQEFTYDHFIREREEKEALTKKKTEADEDAQMLESDNEEEEHDLAVQGWDRQWAERIFLETQEQVSRQLHAQQLRF